MAVEIVCDEVLHWAETYTGAPFHALCADAPYELHFMGGAWDNTGITFCPATWMALARHLLPGAFLMVFASTRGYHRLACALEDAGLILHPCIVWVFGSGFPKATRIDKAIDDAAGLEQIVVGTKRASIQRNGEGENWKAGAFGSHPEATKQVLVTVPATPLAQAWAGHRYGRQALKPSVELIAVAQKPYENRPVDSIVTYGAGALNIDAGRVAGESWGTRPAIKMTSKGKPGGGYGQTSWEPIPGETRSDSGNGRWPPNVCLVHTPACRPLGPGQVRGTHRSNDRSGTMFAGGQGSMNTPDYAASDGTEQAMQWACDAQCPIFLLNQQAGEHKDGVAVQRNGGGQRLGGQGIYHGSHGLTREDVGYRDDDPVSRFFPQHGWAAEVAEQLAGVMPAYYCGKASASERAAGLSGRNPHPTVKPLTLCTWLASLLLPPAAYAPRRLLIPFAGVFSEVVGGVNAGFEEITAIERETSYVEVGTRRLAYWTGQRGTPSAPEAIPDAASLLGQAGEQLMLY